MRLAEAMKIQVHLTSWTKNLTLLCICTDNWVLRDPRCESVVLRCKRGALQHQKNKHDAQMVYGGPRWYSG